MNKMLVPFFLYVITVLLITIFWELSKINSKLRKALHPSEAPFERSLKPQAASERRSSSTE